MNREQVLKTISINRQETIKNDLPVLEKALWGIKS